MCKYYLDEHRTYAAVPILSSKFENFSQKYIPHVCLFVCSLFNSTFSVTEYKESKEVAISK
jgi:hypothetical protein